MEYSKLIGKQVLTQNGKYLGYTFSLFLTEDLSSPLSLCCADEEEEEFYLPYSAVQKAGDAVVVREEKTSLPEGVPCPIGKRVFDESGNFLGVACALTSGNTGVLTVLSPLGEKEYPARRVLVKDSVIVRAKVNTGNKKVAKKQFDEEKTSPSFFGEVYRSNLIGKKVKTDLEGIAEKGEIVSKEMIALAHENNRLLELTAAVLKEVNEP